MTGLLALLRGPLPQILVILIALHGFECRDRRTVRVGLGISAVVVMYAAGFRVDGVDRVVADRVGGVLRGGLRAARRPDGAPRGVRERR